MAVSWKYLRRTLLAGHLPISPMRLLAVVLLSGGYNATISKVAFKTRSRAEARGAEAPAGTFSPLANLGPHVAGQTIKLRFRMGSDTAGAGHGMER